MTEPTRKQRSPMRVAIAILSVAVVVMALIVAYLVWGRTAPTVVPAPTPSASPPDVSIGGMKSAGLGWSGRSARYAR